MSNYPLNYAIRNTKGELVGNLGWLFTMYWLHSDSLLRCYPGNELLKSETGIKSTETLIKHRDMLIKMKALIIVPYDKRITDKEKALHQRKYIYQITGVMQLENGEIIPTVHINSPEVLETHISILADLGFDVSLISQAHGQSESIQNTHSNSKGSEIEPIKVQKLNVSEIEPEVVHKELLSITDEDGVKISSSNTNDMNGIELLLDELLIFKGRYKDRLTFHSDFADYSVGDWLKGLEAFKLEMARKIAEQGDKYSPLPYGYLEKCVSGQGVKRKQSALIEASKPVTPYHLPAVTHEQPRMSDEDATSLMEDFKRIRETVKDKLV